MRTQIAIVGIALAAVATPAIAAEHRPGDDQLATRRPADRRGALQQDGAHTPGGRNERVGLHVRTDRPHPGTDAHLPTR